MTTAPVSQRLRLALVLALLLFAVTRLAGLGSWPLFIDEAQHLHWARRLWEAPLFLRPLTDGKALQVVLAALVVPFVSDPVLAGRLLSVLAGLGGLVLTGLLAREVGGAVAVAAASLLYAVVPFLAVHERMALADPFLATAAGAVLLTTLRLLRAADERGWRLGLALGAAVLAKVPGLMFFAVPAAAAAVAPSARRALGHGLLGGALVAAVPALYFFTSTAQLEEKIEGPDSGVAAGGLLLENATHAAGWLWTYLTPAPALLALAGLGIAVARGNLAARLVALAAVLPVAAFLGAYHWFPRYILPAGIPLLVLAGLAAERLLKRLPRPGLVGAGLAAAALLPALAFDAAMVRAPERVLPPVDAFQYASGWPAGHAGDDAWRTIRDRQRGAPALVVVDAAGHSTVHYVLRTRFMNTPGVDVLMSDVRDALQHGVFTHEPARRHVYVVVTTRRRATPRPFPPDGVRATWLKDLRQGDGTLAGRLYEVLPKAVAR